jgi:acylphosphatase
MSARRVVISGRVQGVGFRDWMRRQANTLGVSGWVRNTRAGTVEALLDGDPGAVAELLRACRRGPPAAGVSSIVEELTDQAVDPGFRKLPTG